jgi:hypothetical protein
MTMSEIAVFMSASLQPKNKENELKLQLSGQTDEAQHSAGLVLVAAVRRVSAVTVSADGCREDILGPESRLDKLTTVGFAEVEKISLGPTGLWAEKGIRESLPGETPPHIAPDFIAVAADARAQSRQDGGRRAAKVQLQGADDFLR